MNNIVQVSYQDVFLNQTPNREGLERVAAAVYKCCFGIGDVRRVHQLIKSFRDEDLLQLRLWPH